MTLAEKALTKRNRLVNSSTEEEVELALLYLQSKLSLAQIQHATNLKPGTSIYVKLLCWSKKAFDEGKIKLS